MTNLGELCIDPRAESDLRWYWSWSQGEMGLRSSFPAMVARLEVGGRTGGAPITDVDERCVEACTRYRTIARALELLRDDQVRVLRMAFGPDAHPLPGLGAVAPVALLVETAHQGHADSRTDRSLEEWLVRLAHRADQRKGTASDRVLVRAIAQEATLALRSAVAAFGSARRVTRRPRRPA